MRCFWLGGISVRKSRDNVYRMIPAASGRARPNVPLTLDGRVDLSSLVASVHVKIEFGVCFGSIGPVYPPCIRQYSFPLLPSLSSVSRLRVKSHKPNLNEATHIANDSKMTIANASHSPA